MSERHHQHRDGDDSDDSDDGDHQQHQHKHHHHHKRAVVRHASTYADYVALMYGDDIERGDTSAAAAAAAKGARVDVVDDAPSAPLVVIDYSATWCKPCKAIAPAYESLARRYAPSSDALFVHVDVDELADGAPSTAEAASMGVSDVHAVAELNGVRKLPTFRFYTNGRRVTWRDAKSGDMLDELKGCDADALQSAVAAVIEKVMGDGTNKRHHHHHRRSHR